MNVNIAQIFDPGEHVLKVVNQHLASKLLEWLDIHRSSLLEKSILNRDLYNLEVISFCDFARNLIIMCNN